MLVGAARFVVMITSSHSLKEKRAIVRRTKARVQEQFKLAVAEVGALNQWQRSELGVALASGNRQYLEQVLDQVARFIARQDDVELIEARRQITTFGDGERMGTGAAGESELAAALAETGAGDKVAGAGDGDWIPAAWRSHDS